MQLEETLWKFGDNKYFAEFPKNLKNVAQSICAKELGLSSLDENKL